MKDFKNLYEVTKTVRFELKSAKINRKQKIVIEDDYIKLTEKFVKKYEQVIQNFKKLIFCIPEDETDEKYLNKNISIKFSWLKIYTKRNFYEIKDQLITYNKRGQKRSNQISIADERVEFLFERFEFWFEKNKEILKDLQEFLKRPENFQKRISDLSYYIHRILNRPNFEFIRELFNGNIQDKTNQDFQKIGKNILECKNYLEALENTLRPYQSMGLVIEKASLNYFTVNKKPKDYPKEIQELKKKLDDKVYNFNIQKPKQDLKDILGKEISNLDNNSFVEANFNGDKNKKLLKQFEYLKIKSAYKFLKEYKASQKSKFYEFIGQGRTQTEIEKEIPLLKCSKKNFNKIKDLTEQILERNNKKEPAKDLAQKRGLHFDIQKEGEKYCSFELYKEICKLYGKIAIKLGQVKAKIKALEKEEIDAQRVNSWALVLEKDNQHYICTIPRDGKGNLLKAKKYADSISGEQDGQWKLNIFESLTLRALEKLCFGYDKNNEFPDKDTEAKNTFMPKVEKEIDNYEYIKRVKENYQKFEYLKNPEKQKKIIKFYQKVLKLDATKKMLAIQNFEDFYAFVNEAYSSLEEFEKEMKKTCYFKKAIPISENTKNYLIDNYQGNFYKITSYDLEKNDKEVLEKLENKKQFDRNSLKKHTQIWLNFWTSNNQKEKYPIRLNPELKISFIERQEDKIIDKYGKKRDIGRLGKNRRNKERYLLSTTITEQSHEKRTNLAFKTKDDVKNFIDEYNDEFNKKIKSPFDICYYGLDRGQKELLTLGIFKFSENEKIEFIKQDGTTGEYHKPLPQKLEIHELKSEKYLEKKNGKTESYKNISEEKVIDDENFVIQKENQYCIDLSCAKLVKNKIVINGDIATYLELKRVSALRKIWEGNSKARFRSEKICFDTDNNALFLNIENRGKLENENLYFFDKRYESILSLDEIKKELQKYFDNLKQENNEEDIISIEKINNLRDALCANAVGILNFLQKQYSGMMFFEDLDEHNKNQRISEFSGNLASRIEWKLLQKFRSKNLVPPTYKQVMNLQSKKEINQLGVLGYIKTKGTSSNCPHCETKNHDKSMKWASHHYKCVNENCNFDSSDIKKRNGLGFCNNSDSVAAYNIAKRGLEFIQEKNKSS